MGDISKLEAIYFAALEKASGERANYLDVACNGDASLRRRVEKMLAAHAAGGSFLESPALAVVPDRPVREGIGDKVQAADDAIGPIVGCYKLLEQIGEGGMGLVYMAQQQQPVRRLVALKIIKPGMDSRQVIARFEAERQALAMMDHPNIAKVLDAGTTGEKDERGRLRHGEDSIVSSFSLHPSSVARPYFVMELVKGVPITKYCDEHRLTLKERLELFVAVCQAIQHAHQKGIIHRDIKPTNVLVARYDERPVPKVIDFGVAKAMQQKLTEKTMFTGFGQLIGTLEYMSPEQAQFNQLDIDTRSDIYSLGVLLYELLTGTTPLEQARRATIAFDETLRIIREHEPPKPSTRLSTVATLPAIAANRGVAPAQLRRQVTGDLDWIVMRCLEKDRNRRYETAGNLAIDIQHYLRDEPVQARPPSAIYRLKKLVLRNQASVALAAGALLAVLIAAASVGWTLRDRAARASQIAQAEADRQAAVERQVRDSLATARTLVADNKLVAAREKLAQAKSQAGSGGSAVTGLVVEIKSGEAELDRLQQFLDLIDCAHQAETAPIRESESAWEEPGSAPSPSAAGFVSRHPAAAVPYFVGALQCYGVLERDDWQITPRGSFLASQQIEQVQRSGYEALLWLADDIVRRRQEHSSEQKISRESAAQQALVYLDKAAQLRSPTHALHLLRGRCHTALGEDAIAEADAQLAAETPQTMAIDYYPRGHAALNDGRMAEGVEAFQAALRLEPTHYWSLMQLGYCLCDCGERPDDFAAATLVFTGCILRRPDHAHAYYCRGRSYYRQQRYDEALVDYSKTIELDPHHSKAWYGRGFTLHSLRQPDKAVDAFNQAIQLAPKDPRGWYGRAYSQESLGHLNKALADFTQALELEPERSSTWYGRGIVHDRLEQHDQARADFAKAVELNPKHARAWYHLGIVNHKLGHFHEGLKAFSEAIELLPQDALGWHARGRLQSKAGQPEQARADFTKAIELNPKFALAWADRGSIYNRLNQREKAVADFSKAIELDPKNANAWYGRAVAYDRLKQNEKALADNTQAIELDPQHARAWYGRGVAHQLLGHPEKALDDFNKSIELDPSADYAWSGRGVVHNKLGRLNKALADLDKSLELNPSNAYSWNTRGLVHKKTHQFDLALSDFTKSIELDAKSAPTWENRASTYGKLGQPDKALADYLRAIELAPTRGSAHNSLAWFLATCTDAKVQDAGRAVVAAKKAVELSPSEGVYWNTLGVAQFRAGDWTAAIAALEKSIALRNGGDACDRFFLAMSRWKRGQTKEAAAQYEEGLEWLQNNKEKLLSNPVLAEELSQFQAEAEHILGEQRCD